MTNNINNLLNKEYMTEKDLDRILSIIIAEKINEGYTLTEERICDFDSRNVYTFLDEEDNRYALAVLYNRKDGYNKIAKLDVEWGKIEKNRIFEFEGETEHIITFGYIVRHGKAVIFPESRIEEINKTIKNRRKYYNNHRNFVAKRLNIKGLKREKDIKVTRIVNRRDMNIAYQVYKNDKVYKEVKF